MEREEFGEWGRRLEDRAFWQAAAMLGIIGGLSWLRETPQAPRNIREAERIVGGGDFPDLYMEPADESPGLLWSVDEAYRRSARRGELVAAEWLAEQWQAHRRGQWYVRMHGLELFSNQQEIAAALRKHAGAVLHFPLPQRPPGEDWQWPLRIALSPWSRQKTFWRGLREWQTHSRAAGQLGRFSHAGGEPVVEILVLSGAPAEALEDLETLPAPIRAHCLILLPEGGTTLDQEQVQALFRLQQRSLAKGVVISSLRDADPSRWIIDLMYGLARNVAIDQALADHSMPLPLMFFDPALFRLAKAGSFAEKITAALEIAGETLLDLGPKAARGIALDEGRYPAMDVAYRLRDTLRGPDASDEEKRESTVEILRAARKDNVLKEARRAASEVREPQPERRLQVNVWGEEEGRPAEDFHPARHYDVEAWIGQRGGALSGAEFPAELLPGEEDGYLLTMTFFAPGHTEQPIVENVYLPRGGDSTSCRFSFEAGAELPRLEARITIAYLNRVLQTYLLTGGPGEALALTPEMTTEADWRGLDFQTPYGATIVLNRMQGQAHAMMQAGYKALAFSLDGLNDAMTQMESKLDSSQWDSADFKGLKAKGSSKLVLYLAKHGFYLLEAMKQYAPSDQAGQSFLDNLLNADPVQVLAANLGARLPVELFYSNPYPEDHAKLCPTYDGEPHRQSCNGCPHADQDHYCPLGFWSLRKVIEWHDFEAAKLRQQDFAPREFAVQTADNELRRDRLAKVDQALIGLSGKVDKVEPESTKKLIARIRKAGIEPVVAKGWKDWASKVQPDGHRLLVLLPHTAKNEFDEECLEISGQTIAKIDATHVAGGRRPGPIVLLIGCNTENLGIPFRNFAVRFMTAGSAIVVSTISHVLGRHAAPLAAELVAAIVEAQSDEHATFGALMRQVRRNWLRSELPPISLSLKCYGDARWRF